MSKTVAIFLPPLAQVSGGLMVLLQLGNHLHALGTEVMFVLHDEAPSSRIFSQIQSLAKAPLMLWSEAHLSEKHVWVVPDGWPNALLPGIRAGSRCIVYMQNWAFALRTLPEGVQWHQLPVEFLYVSEPVRYCLREITGLDGPILRPGIDTALFYPPDIEDARSPVQGKLRVAWMPRKNKALGLQIIDAFTQRTARLYPQQSIEWVEIQKIPHEHVGEFLRTCHIFLATGFPEGFSLPPLEAMASGCIPVGFSGLGGWDYMRSCSWPDVTMPFLAKPFFQLGQTPLDEMIGGNGFFVEDAQILAATLALEQAMLLLYRGGEALALLRNTMAQTAAAYSVEVQRAQIHNLEPFFTA